MIVQTCETNSSLCPTCPEGFIYDIPSKQCIQQVCPSGYQYNKETGMC